MLETPNERKQVIVYNLKLRRRADVVANLSMTASGAGQLALWICNNTRASNVASPIVERTAVRVFSSLRKLFQPVQS